MCLMVWVGSAKPLPPRPAPQGPDGDPLLSFHYVEPVPEDAPVRARFSLPSVSYVGSCCGCGCGFNSSFACFGFSTVHEILELADAMLEDERTSFLEEQRVRQRLSDLIVEALVDGPVEVYGCWAGNEVKPVRGECEVSPEHFALRLEPIWEEIRYRIVSHGEAANTGAAAPAADGA